MSLISELVCVTSGRPSVIHLAKLLARKIDAQLALQLVLCGPWRNASWLPDDECSGHWPQFWSLGDMVPGMATGGLAPHRL